MAAGGDGMARSALFTFKVRFTGCRVAGDDVDVVAHRLTLPTTYHLLNTLVDQGLLAKDEERRFILGQSSARVAEAYLRGSAIPETLLGAIRQLAVQRKISGSFFKRVAPQYLLLLAISQTCRFQGKSFLKFLLSKETDLDSFRRTRPIKYSYAVPMREEGSSGRGEGEAASTGLCEGEEATDQPRG